MVKRRATVPVFETVHFNKKYIASGDALKAAPVFITKHYKIRIDFGLNYR